MLNNKRKCVIHEIITNKYISECADHRDSNIMTVEIEEHEQRVFGLLNSCICFLVVLAKINLIISTSRG